jgi:hypothetical protein
MTLPNAAHRWLVLALLPLSFLGRGTAQAEVPPAHDATLNDLLAEIRDLMGKGATGTKDTLDAKVLRSLNLSKNGNSLGMLRKDVAIRWPPALMNEDFASERKAFAPLFSAAREQVQQRAVDEGVTTELAGGLQRMERLLMAQITDLTPLEYISAKRYLRELGGAVKAMRDPKTKDYLAAVTELGAKDREVRDVILRMAGYDLHFGPASPGSEEDYRTVYKALAAYAEAARHSGRSEPRKK